MVPAEIFSAACHTTHTFMPHMPKDLTERHTSVTPNRTKGPGHDLEKLQMARRTSLAALFLCAPEGFARGFKGAIDLLCGWTRYV